MEVDPEVEVHEAVIGAGHDGRHPDEPAEGVADLGPEDPRPDDRQVFRWQDVVGPEVADRPVVEVGGILLGPTPMGRVGPPLQATRFGPARTGRSSRRRDPGMVQQLVDRAGDAPAVVGVGVLVPEDDEGRGRFRRPEVGRSRSRRSGNQPRAGSRHGSGARCGLRGRRRRGAWGGSPAGGPGDRRPAPAHPSDSSTTGGRSPAPPEHTNPTRRPSSGGARRLVAPQGQPELTDPVLDDREAGIDDHPVLAREDAVPEGIVAVTSTAGLATDLPVIVEVEAARHPRIHLGREAVRVVDWLRSVLCFCQIIILEQGHGTPVPGRNQTRFRSKRSGRTRWTISATLHAWTSSVRDRSASSCSAWSRLSDALNVATRIAPGGGAAMTSPARAETNPLPQPDQDNPTVHRWVPLRSSRLLPGSPRRSSRKEDNRHQGVASTHRIWRLDLPIMPKWYKIHATIQRRMSKKLVKPLRFSCLFASMNPFTRIWSEPGNRRGSFMSPGRSWPTCVFVPSIALTSRPG